MSTLNFYYGLIEINLQKKRSSLLKQFLDISQGQVTIPWHLFENVLASLSPIGRCLYLYLWAVTDKNAQASFFTTIDGLNSVTNISTNDIAVAIGELESNGLIIIRRSVVLEIEVNRHWCKSL